MFSKNFCFRRKTGIAHKFGEFRFLKCLVIFHALLLAGCADADLSFAPEQSKAKNVVEQTAEKKLVKETRARFLAVGDIMLSRGVNRAIEREKNPLLPFSALGDLLRSSDFNFGNLESPVSGNDRRFGRGLIFNTHTHDVQGLTEYNFKIVSLANNHAFDQGLKGLQFTQKFLDEKAIQYVGVGEDKAQAWQGKTVTAGNIRVGFIGASYSSINDGGASKNEFVARIEEVEFLKSSIEKLKTESNFIVVTMHAGVEYTRRPHRSQIIFARRAIDAGADLVVGTHPHWIQTFEKYRGKYIFYSLGNFIFDQRKTDTKQGLVLQISLIRRDFDDASFQIRIEKIELIPVVSERLGVPRRATETEAKAILKKIGADEPFIFPSAEN